MVGERDTNAYTHTRNVKKSERRRRREQGGQHARSRDRVNMSSVAPPKRKLYATGHQG